MIYMKYPEQGNPWRQKKKKLVLLGSRENGEWRMIASGYEVSLGGDDNILEFNSGDCSTL